MTLRLRWGAGSAPAALECSGLLLSLSPVTDPETQPCPSCACSSQGPRALGRPPQQCPSLLLVPWGAAGRGQGPAATGTGGCPLAFPAFTWEVRANDRGYHKQFKKKFAFCLSKRKYSVSQEGPGLPFPSPSPLSQWWLRGHGRDAPEGSPEGWRVTHTIPREEKRCSLPAGAPQSCQRRSRAV